jgi:hypothetical protein
MLIAAVYPSRDRFSNWVLPLLPINREYGKYTDSFWHGLADLQLAGALQAAIYNSLDGHSGLAGWRWMFVGHAYSN